MQGDHRRKSQDWKEGHGVSMEGSAMSAGAIFHPCVALHSLFADVRSVAFSTVPSWGSWESQRRRASRENGRCCSVALPEVPGHASQPAFFQPQRETTGPWDPIHRTQYLPHCVETVHQLYASLEWRPNSPFLTPLFPLWNGLHLIPRWEAHSQGLDHHLPVGLGPVVKVRTITVPHLLSRVTGQMDV